MPLSCAGGHREPHALLRRRGAPAAHQQVQVRSQPQCAAARAPFSLAARLSPARLTACVSRAVDGTCCRYSLLHRAVRFHLPDDRMLVAGQEAPEPQDAELAAQRKGKGKGKGASNPLRVPRGRLRPPSLADMVGRVVRFRKQRRWGPRELPAREGCGITRAAARVGNPSARRAVPPLACVHVLRLQSSRGWPRRCSWPRWAAWPCTCGTGRASRRRRPSRPRAPAARTRPRRPPHHRRAAAEEPESARRFGELCPVWELLSLMCAKSRKRVKL